MSTITVNCQAGAGTVALPGAGGPVTLPAWGYALDPGLIRVPGPVLQVTAGDVLQVVLTNGLPEPVSLMVPGLSETPRPVKDADGRLLSLVDHAGPGESVTYVLSAPHPGTYRYESGSNPAVQVQMGLYGVLIVRPAGYDAGNPATWTAYGPDTGTEYDREYLLVLGEVDSRLRASIGAGLTFNLLDFRPDWWTINGRAHPDTTAPDNASSQPMGAHMTGTVGERLLLRCVNAGFEPHALACLGLAARVVAQDGFPLKPSVVDVDATHEEGTVLIAPGGVTDLILALPFPGQFPLIDRDFKHAVNEDRFPGGMLTILDVP